VVNLILNREKMLPDRTLGRLYIEASYANYYTLEDTDRKMEEGGVKIPGKTAIPRGKYRVVLTMSFRFKRILPLLLDVPGFTGIRIHNGNTPEDTEGCILIGTRYNEELQQVSGSRVAVENLVSLLNRADVHGEEIWITVS
jgi:hypothetical protein